MNLWRCDRDGGYSTYSGGVEDENYLRGVQEAGADDEGDSRLPTMTGSVADGYTATLTVGVRASRRWSGRASVTPWTPSDASPLSRSRTRSGS